MSVLASRPTLRWALPATALVGVIVAGSAGKMLIANASDGLPERSPEQLLMDVAQAKVDGLSGTIVQKSDLGLPPLPEFGSGQHGSNLSSMLTGNHTARVWYDGPQRVRVSLLGNDSSESDVIRNGSDLWVYKSANKSATHRKLPAGEQHAKGPSELPSGAPSVLPSGMPSGMPTSLSGGVGQLLASLAPRTDVSTDGTAKVAGRDAYELVLQPKDSASRIHQIRIAVDGAKHIPLRLQVYARGSDTPAFETAFTHVSFSRPDAAEFGFKPPAGTKVTELKSKADKAGEKRAWQGKPGHQPGDRWPGQGKAKAGDEPQVIGKGWTTVAVAKGVPTTIKPGSTPEQKQAAAAATKFLNSLPKVHGSWGSGRLFESKLFSALLTDDGRLLVGPVDPDKLYAAAAQSK
jgi:outer membrane lipoprotein-sorting protein